MRSELQEDNLAAPGITRMRSKSGIGGGNEGQGSGARS